MTEEEKRQLENLEERKKKVMESNPRYKALMACATRDLPPAAYSYWIDFISKAYRLGVDVGVITGMNL